MRTSAASWFVVGWFAALSLGASACELLVGGGDYKTGDAGSGSSGAAGSGVASSGTVSSGGSSGTGSSGTVSSGASSGVAGSGTVSSGGSSGTGSSGTVSSGASSGVASSGTVSSGASSGAGGDAGGNVSAFLGTWQLSLTETLSNCSISSADGASTPQSGTFVWMTSGSGMMGSGLGCTFNAMVSGTVALLGANSMCTITSTDETDQYTFKNAAWDLNASGTTASVFLTGTVIVTPTNGTSFTCSANLSGSATR